MMGVVTNALAEAIVRVEEAERELSLAVEDRDAEIRKLKGQTGATELSRMTGLSRARIYQIWDGTR